MSIPIGVESEGHELRIGTLNNKVVIDVGGLRSYLTPPNALKIAEVILGAIGLKPEINTGGLVNGGLDKPHLTRLG